MESSNSARLEVAIAERATRRGLHVNLERVRYSNTCLLGDTRQKPPSILVVGVGHGHDIMTALADGLLSSATGVDPFIESDGNGDVDYSELLELIQKTGMNDRCRVVRSTIQEHLATSDMKYDLVLAADVLHHIFVTRERLVNSEQYESAIALFSELYKVTEPWGRMIISETSRLGLRPQLTNWGVLKGCVDYRTKQNQGQWTRAVESAGWRRCLLRNYYPFAFKACATFLPGPLGRYSVCDRYVLRFAKKEAGSAREV